MGGEMGRRRFTVVHLSKFYHLQIVHSDFFKISINYTYIFTMLVRHGDYSQAHVNSHWERDKHSEEQQQRLEVSDPQDRPWKYGRCGI